MISVIIPVFNGANTLGGCLRSVFASDYPGFEVIVVDDHSTDNSRAIARTMPCSLIELPFNSGPGAARNYGARAASGALLVFLDADILMRPDSLSHIAARFAERRDIAALFGSYQADTPHRDFVSQYKNLLNHYTHQNSRSEAATFASGVGSVRREVFAALGGFDPAQWYMEDIEFGYRMRRAGHRILLDKQLQMTHCKRYTLRSLVRSDFFARAIPWTHLMLKTRTFQNDLNTKSNNVVSVPISVVLLAAPLTLRFPWTGPITLILIAAFLILNRDFLIFVLHQKGWWFTTKAALMTWFTYLYSGAGALLGFAQYCTERFHDRAETPTARVAFEVVDRDLGGGLERSDRPGAPVVEAVRNQG